MKSQNSKTWLSKLISFDTTSRNSNLELINFVANNLIDFKLKPEIIYSSNKDKANLFVTIPAKDGQIDGGIILSGHTDVVPVDGQNWNSNPFELVEKNNCFFGRGSCDMKGFIAVSLALIPKFLEHKQNKPLHLAFSYDEEVGCLGAPIMINELIKQGRKFDGCVVGEPTNMKIVTANKGINLYRCCVHGKAAHSSLTPYGTNAIEYAALLICQIRKIAEEFKIQGPFDEFFDVPFTTMTTNLIQGGNGVNIIPALCEFYYEFRNLPKIPHKEIQIKVDEFVKNNLLPKMKAEFSEAKIEIESLAPTPGLEESEESEITKLARALTGDLEKHKVAYGTEAGLFHNVGIPTIVCGPGSIEQAHKPDEFVSLKQLNICEDFLRKLSFSLTN